jgi:Family of unknown function (DUF5313)
VSTVGARDDEVRRPGPLRWLWYAVGGSLPARNSRWVFQDTTAPNWAWRHMARAVVQMLIPIALVLLFVPGPFWIRGMAALGGLLIGLLFSAAYMTETTENRLVRAGYPSGTGQAARDEVSKVREARDTERRHAAAAKRAERYRRRAGQ